jgi:hypothetical protein
MHQIIKIYLVWIKSLFHKVFANLGKEIVTAICALVLVGLFFYMFTDFLNAQLSLIDQSTQQAAKDIFSYLICTISAGLSVSFIKTDNPTVHFSTSGWLYAIGESPKVLWGFRALRALTISAILSFISYRITTNLIESSPENLFGFSIATFIIATLFGLVLKPKPKVVPELKEIPTNKFLWRLNIILKRNRISKALIKISSAFSLLLLLPQVAGSTLFTWAIFFIIGLVASFSLYSHLSEEISSSWLDKNSGMSHIEFIGLTIKTSASIGFALCLFTIFIYIFSLQIQGLHFSLLFGIQLIFTLLIPTLVVPNIILQIDARRTSINMMSGFLISLFLCTAVFAHIAAVILIPILFYYGQSTQVDRYYRA